jgi:hypothetical protein
MDDQQQQRVNEAAERFAEALRESYRTVASRGESAQQLNAEMTQQFFNTVSTTFNATQTPTYKWAKSWRGRPRGVRKPPDSSRRSLYKCIWAS